MRPRNRRIVWLAAFAAIAIFVATRPASRTVVVDKVLTEEVLPLWVKTVNFVDRDLNFSRTADAVVGHIDGDEARALAALRWTRENIHPQPRELPSRDDHVWSIIVRGYGEPDQQADVFTTLLTYQHVPAYWILIGRAPKELPISYVKIGGDWRVFDVAHGLVFRRRDGAMATPQDIASDLTIVEAAARGTVAELDPYVAYFDGYRSPDAPDVLRADLQMPARRAMYELKSWFGIEGRVWNIRPHTAAPGLGASR